MDERISGRVVDVLRAGGYFVLGEDGNEYIFFRREVNFRPLPKKNAEVTFIPKDDGGKYPHATDVQKARQEIVSRWIDNTYGQDSDDIECPRCHGKWSVIDNCTETFNYCPGCGAKLVERK